MTARRTIDRRGFLASIGAGAALLPTLDAARARADCLVPGPKRVVFVTWQNGILGGTDQQWPVPRGSDSDFVLPEFLLSMEKHRNDLIFVDRLAWKCLDDSPVRAISDDIIMLSPETGGRNGHHANQALLTGLPYPGVYDGDVHLNVASGSSIDQHIAEQLRASGYPGIPSISLGVMLTQEVYAVWKKAGVSVVPDVDPSHVFDTLFGGAQAAADPMRQKLRMARGSVLDYVGHELDRFRARLGSDDRQRVDAHLAAVRQIESDLARPVQAPVQCARPPDLDARLDVRDAANMQRVLRLQIDLIVNALAADATRVAVLQLGGSGMGLNSDAVRFPFIGMDAGHHLIVHAGGSPGDRAGMDKVATWFIEQWSYLVDQLKSRTDGGRRLLDDTVVLFINPMSHGDTHDYHNVPVILAGSCGGYFKTGRAIKAGGAPQNGVLLAMANAMGVPTDTWGPAATRYGGELTSLRG